MIDDSRDVVVRPDGRVYRPTRKKLTLHHYDDPDNGLHAIVLGTHDVGKATAFLDSKTDADHDPGVRVWARMTFVEGGQPWWDTTDTARGAPAVIFRVIQD